MIAYFFSYLMLIKGFPDSSKLDAVLANDEILPACFSLRTPFARKTMIEDYEIQ